MQCSGSLKKRRKRNLAKVNGLTTVSYDDILDTYDGSDLFSAEGLPLITPRTTSKSGHSLIHLNTSDMSHYRNTLSTDRITRNPIFHQFHDNLEDIIEVDTFHDNINSAYNFEEFNQEAEPHDRSHFLDKPCMNRLVSILYLGIISGTFPWTWNGRDKRIERWKTSWLISVWWVIWTLFQVQSICLMLFQLYSFLQNLSLHDNRTNREIFMNWIGVTFYFYALDFVVTMFFYKERMREYINTLLHFNQKFVKKYLIHLDDYRDGGRLVVNVSIPSNAMQVVTSVMLFLGMPYQPWYLFHYIYPKPWYWLIPGAIQEFALIGQLAVSHMIISWISVAHGNTVEFWLKEIHNNNDSDYTRGELRHPRSSLEMYRSLQVLSNCFNACMAPLSIPVIKINIMTAVVFCGYVLIRSMNQKFIDDFPGILKYPVAWTDCGTVGFVIMSTAARIVDLSISFIDSWSRTKNRNFRRILMSCGFLRVKVRHFYFITVATTITFFRTMFDFITNLIITFP